MRTFTHNAALICLALSLSIGASTAIAADNAARPNLCYGQWNILANNGYSPNATYSVGDIMQLFRNAQVAASPMYLRADTNYRLVYNCYIDQQLAHVSLQAIPLNATRDGFYKHPHYVYNGDNYNYYYDPYFDRHVAVFDHYNRGCHYSNCVINFTWTKSR